jgi:hypothetical protein
VSDCIKLKKLLEVLQGAYDKHKSNPDCADSISVEFWLGDKMVELDRIGQFGVVPDVTICLKATLATEQPDGGTR